MGLLGCALFMCFFGFVCLSFCLPLFFWLGGVGWGEECFCQNISLELLFACLFVLGGGGGVGGVLVIPLNKTVP